MGFKEILSDLWCRLRNGNGQSLWRNPSLGKLLLLMGGGILLMILTGPMLSPRSQPVKQSEPQVSRSDSARDELSTIEEDLENRLEEALSSVAGAGRVQVTVTLASGPERVYAWNFNKQNRVVEEKDQAGGNRTTTESNEQDSMVFSQSTSGGRDDPVVITSKRPEIAGVLVLAEGAGDPHLRERLAGAVETLLNIPPHKVTVLAKGSR